MKTFGIDVSAHQGNFDFKRAKNEGVEFVIIRGAWGTNMDKKFETYYKQAKDLGLNVGLYIYSYAKTVDEAKLEAEYLYNHCIKGKQYELPIYFDIEDKTQLGLSKQLKTNMVKAFCDYLGNKNCWAGVYASLDWFKNKLNDNELQNYAHWVAQWSKNCTYKGEDGVLGMWQFGGETNVIRSNKVAGQVCDQNYMLIDYPTEMKKAGRNGFTKTNTPTKPVQKQETLTEVAKKVIRGDFKNQPLRSILLKAYLIKNKLPYTLKQVQNKVNELMKK